MGNCNYKMEIHEEGQSKCHSALLTYTPINHY